MASARHLQEFPLHLAADGSVRALREFIGGPSWYETYERDHEADGPAGRLVSWHSFDSSWDSWEMHPNGDEIVVCVEGVVTLVQELSHGVTTTTLGRGQWAINTAGTWHTADMELGTSASCLFITSGLGTQQRSR